VLLLQADLGSETSNQVIKKITSQLNRQQLNDQTFIYESLRNILIDILKPCEQPLIINTSHKPFIILLVGVNGAGKTTSIAKLANIYKNLGKKVILAAGDTFRAAAIEQLTSWGDKLDIPVIKEKIGADSASVIFDAYNFAIQNKYDVLIVDTSGRLHNKKNLMEEIKKINKVLKRIDPAAPHETMLVLDASIGQNSLNQVKSFNEAIGISGITITKLDGTAKAGVIFAIANHFNIPIRYLGIGEKLNDLKIFEATQFVDAILE
ncbi:MAG: signal recognition particle-docking protein FtsY, partial [Gammaproteobacteria bacterium]